MNKQTTWVKVNGKLQVSEVKASNGKPMFKFEKNSCGNYWQLGVCDEAKNGGYRWSQFTTSKFPEIKKFFADCDLEKVGRCLDELSA